MDPRSKLVEAVRLYLASMTANAEVIDNTPTRFVNALEDMLVGHRLSPHGIDLTTFPCKASGPVVLRGIPFSSLCEHHLMTYHGQVSVGYLPAKRVLGLSKIPRMVRLVAARLSIQEQLTDDIAEHIASVRQLNPLGVGVKVVASHSCMECRGVRTPGVQTITLARRGEFDLSLLDD